MNEGQHPESEPRTSRSTTGRVRTSRRSVLAASSAALTVSLGGCVVGGRTTETVTFGTLPIATVAPVLIAEERGYFEERNVEIERERIAGVPPATPRLASGEIDVAGGSVGAPIFNSIAQGVRIQIAADMAQHYHGAPAGAKVWARENIYSEGIEFPELADRVDDPLTVAHNAKGGSLDYVLGRILDLYDMSWDDVEVKEIGFSNMIPAMLSGDTDVCIAPDPLGLALGGKANAGQVLYASAALPRMQMAAYFFGGPFMEDRPDVAAGWIEGLILGIREYYEMGAYPSEEVATIVNEAFGIDVGAVRSSVPALPNRNGTVNMNSIMRQQDYHACRGYVEDAVDSDEIRNEELWEKALDSVGRLPEGEAKASPKLLQTWSERAPRPYPPMGEIHPVEDFPSETVCE